ncbi:Peptidoglycan/xylan/chitin deacetylase, PgdA/CDA1 family [Paramicrobacterium humi]|uniref:Peptidoglycan/xylan/chitin deacetylase, PgdA/CDA1 family n=1 Tax=Paramicrobacterium humi TaxID=640635 RepID=A0A1H4K8G9_9MICO|nr:polysaccharide deacetylase family protein [Microbacterium humi]SEB54723.1 Peptidoglycan/xylan/chitin deacetylase, PgdA/CDA1 family [Microbacterium humi]
MAATLEMILKGRRLQFSNNQNSIGPIRDYIGYGGQSPTVQWPNDAKLAINFVINYEEGSEYSFLQDGENDNYVEVTYNFPENIRDLSRESMYEYGSRAGIWRLFRILEEYGVPATMYACAQAFEVNPVVAKHARNAGYDLLSHGLRWTETWRYSREEEKQAIETAIASFQETWGERPEAWYCRYGSSVNTRELVVEEGGFVYDSDSYNDDLPYYANVEGQPHLVIPYSLTYNDMQGTKSPATFVDYVKRGIDELWREGDAGNPKMMSIGLHPRLMGQAGRANALREVIEYALDKGDVWFARRMDIAKHWLREHPASVSNNA